MQMQKYMKRLKPPPANNCEFLQRLTSDMLQHRDKSPAGLSVNEDGLAVRVELGTSVAEVATALNPGFVELGLGSPEDALAAILKHSPPPDGAAKCVVVPADGRCAQCRRCLAMSVMMLHPALAPAFAGQHAEALRVPLNCVGACSAARGVSEHTYMRHMTASVRAPHNGPDA